ncbi:hypothetical protein KP509_25G065600 [Ceratopteris richardii]|uniref:ZFAND2A/B-like C2H2 zinc finger domain-containing protein n=1 Tax=Ceratopteris richardii TaxID=49495 RepID=A0A8T2RR30_CERRI|nr:hypothetical protein KP509_25G065600 [Ceratopteris richardii]
MDDTKAFPNLGAHCSQPDCHLMDFLPFNCDLCKVIICPICASSVRTLFGENMDLTLKEHMQENCDPNNHDRIMKKPKCPVKRWHEVMLMANTYMCKTCKVKVCLNDRFLVDHLCMMLVEMCLATFVRRGIECASSSTQAGPKIGSPASQNLSAH